MIYRIFQMFFESCDLYNPVSEVFKNLEIFKMEIKNASTTPLAFANKRVTFANERETFAL